MPGRRQPSILGCPRRSCPSIPSHAELATRRVARRWVGFYLNDKCSVKLFFVRALSTRPQIFIAPSATTEQPRCWLLNLDRLEQRLARRRPVAELLAVVRKRGGVVV